MSKKDYPLENLMKDLLDIKPLLFFVLLCSITFLLLYIKKNFIEYEITAFQILDERGQLGMFKMISALQYFTIPAVYLFKFTLIAFLLWVSSFAFGYRITFASCWQVAMVSEIIFIVPELIKIFWFLVVETDPVFPEVRAFYPLSLMNFFDYTTVGHKFHYPLKALNLFEVVYWVMIIAGIYVKSGKEYKKSLYIGITGSILPFLFWLGYYMIIYK